MTSSYVFTVTHNGEHYYGAGNYKRAEARNRLTDWIKGAERAGWIITADDGDTVEMSYQGVRRVLTVERE